MKVTDQQILSDATIVNFRIKTVVINFLIMLFCVFVIFASYSVNKFVARTMSMNFLIVTPNSALQETQVAEEYEASFKAISRTVKVKKNDTISSILMSQKIPSDDIAQILRVMKEQKAESVLQLAQNITFDYEIRIVEDADVDLATEKSVLTKMTINNKLRTLEIIRKDDSFFARNTNIPLKKTFAKSSVAIRTNFVSALKDLGLSSNNIVEITNAYSYQVDFERQIKTGDKVEVLSEKFLTKDGKFSHFGKIMHVSLNSSGKEYNIYRYSTTKATQEAFFSEDGKSAKRSLLRTPLNSSRISSHYGKRKHPISGYTKMHKGVDFPAPTGTPINAAGSGVITEMGWKSGYGNFVQIKHSATLSTAYAHASAFAKNLKVGHRVKRGQVIAFVGSTGNTTGSHLHFELKINGQNVNPTSIKTMPDLELTNKSLAEFHKFKDNIRSVKSKLDTKLAKL